MQKKLIQKLTVKLFPISSTENSYKKCEWQTEQ